MIKNRLPVLLAEQYLKMSDLSRMTGIPKGTILKIFHNRFSCINLEHIHKICNALGVKFEELFEYTPD